MLIERLAAAIAYYNSQSYLVGRGRRSWPSLLKNMDFDPNSGGNGGGVCHSCRYSVSAREAVFGQNLRTYVWRGTGDGLDLDHDREIADAPGFPETTTPWCFYYGERVV